MNQKKIYHNIKDLFVYYLTISSDQAKNQNLEKIFPFYVIKLSDKVTEMFTLHEIDQNIDLFQEQLELCLQTGDFEFLLQEKEINMILLFLEAFYFAAEKLMNLEKEKYALFLLEAEKQNKNLFETEEHKRKLKKNLN